MDDTLNQLYHGEISPANHEIWPVAPEYQEKAANAKVYLEEHLTGKDKEVLQQLCSSQFAYGLHTDFRAFVSGYRLGARLMMHMLSEEYPEVD